MIKLENLKMSKQFSYRNVNKIGELYYNSIALLQSWSSLSANFYSNVNDNPLNTFSNVDDNNPIDGPSCLSAFEIEEPEIKDGIIEINHSHYSVLLDNSQYSHLLNWY